MPLTHEERRDLLIKEGIDIDEWEKEEPTLVERTLSDQELLVLWREKQEGGGDVIVSVPED